MEASEILKEAQDIFNNYCASTCKSMCCKKGSLSLTKKESSLFKNSEKLIEKENGLYEYKLSPGCQYLDENNFCKIHKNKEIPHLCSEYPFFIKSKLILVAEKCPAVQNDKLIHVIKNLKENGFKILLI